MATMFNGLGTRLDGTRPDTGAAPRLAAQEWALLREPPTERDMKLTGLALSWLERLPLPLRPVNLCSRYPRVANRLALCWSDAVLCGRLFDDLLVDRRGNRKGFPPPVAEELMRLRVYRTQKAVREEPAKLWELQAPTDR